MESLQTGSSTIFTLPSTITLVAAKYHIRDTLHSNPHSRTRHNTQENKAWPTYVLVFPGRVDWWCPQDTSHLELVLEPVSLNPSDGVAGV